MKTWKMNRELLSLEESLIFLASHHLGPDADDNPNGCRDHLKVNYLIACYRDF